MKRALLCSLLAVLLSGCVVAPYGDRDDGGYRYRGYYDHDHRDAYGYDYGFGHGDHG
jgi:hypothetical protein